MHSDDPRAELPVPNRRLQEWDRPYAPPPLAPDTGPVFEPPPPRRQRVDRGMRSDLGLVGFVLVAGVMGVVVWNVAGSVTGGILRPQRTPPAIALHDPSPSPTTRPSGAAVTPPASSESPAASVDPSVLPSPAPTATPRPARKAVTVRIERRPAAVFASEQEATWCAAAAVQIALNVVGPDVDTSRARQARILGLLHDATTRRDSRNGGTGPLGMVATLERLGKVDYELRIHDTRAEALYVAARQIRKTGHPAILLAWRGAHAWVMSGFKADADPTVFKNARVTGAYIIDPWYPRVSSIWGRSDGPGVFQDAAEMKRNYLPWRRPEGRYPGRDGNFLVIVPVS